MHRILITTTFLVGLGTAAIAAPNHDGQVFRADSTETDAEPSPGWVRETIDSARREADEMAAIAREQGISAVPVRQAIENRVQFQSPEIVSILREDWAYEGGSGTLWLIPVNWNIRANTLIPIQSVLGDPADGQYAYDRVATLLREAIAQQVWHGEPRDWSQAIDASIRPDPMYLSTFTFVPSTVPDRIGGIAWHFEPSMVAPGSEGAVSVIIPQADLREVIAPEWHELFAGEPAERPAALYVSSGDERLHEVLASH